MSTLSTLDAAKVFTNEKNEVIFADRNFYRLLRREDTETVVGERLHRALGLPDEAPLQFMREALEDGYIRDTILEFTDRRGRRIRVTATGRAALDDRGRVIGANLELWGAVTVLSGEGSSEQIIDELPAGMTIGTELGIVQGYVVAQMTSLYVLMMRSVGENISRHLDETVNKAAKRAGVETRMTNGLLDLDPQGMDAQVYPVLLADAVRYAMDIIGPRRVNQELRSVDERMDPRTLALAGEYRLLDLQL